MWGRPESPAAAQMTQTPLNEKIRCHRKSVALWGLFVMQHCCSNNLLTQTTWKEGTILIPILQWRKRRLGEVKGLAPGHDAARATVGCKYIRSLPSGTEEGVTVHRLSGLSPGGGVGGGESPDFHDTGGGSGRSGPCVYQPGDPAQI